MAWGNPDAETKVNHFEGTPKVEVIHLDGLVLLQIMKHSRENLPNCVAGTLLGLENSETLQVTNSFPSPNRLEVENAVDDSDEYQIDMMKNLREMNVDNNVVGWYQSSHCGLYCNVALIEDQYNYQEALGPNAVCLIYDPLHTTKGYLSIKAIRLTDLFYQKFSEGVFSGASLADGDLRSNKIFEEVPIKIHNSELITSWLYQIRKKEYADCDFDRLDLSINTFLEKNLQDLSGWMDELAVEHSKFQHYERNLSKQKAQQQQWLAKRREENKIRRDLGDELLPEEDPTLFKPIAEPSRLESLLITKQINSYCQQINHFAGKSFQKLFAVGSLHKD